MIVYHYTSSDALLNILDSKIIWATHFEYLNDKTEFYHAKEVIKDVLDDIDDEFVIKYKDIFELCVDQIYEIYDVYTCSFSKESDSLSQWRGYCPSDGGFAIGFNLDDLTKDRNYLFSDCIYNNSEKKLRVERLAKEFCTNVQSIIDGKKINFSKHWERIFKNIVIKPYTKDQHKHPLDLEKNHIYVKYELAKLAACMKSEAFSSESEFRYVNIVNKGESEEIEIRSRDSLLIPYMEVKVSEETIKEVIIGPSINMNQNSNSLKVLQKRNNYTFSVEESKIPFKNW